MVRAIRILGLVLFATLLGVSGHSLLQLQANGSVADGFHGKLEISFVVCAVSFAGLILFSWMEIQARKDKPSLRSYYQRKRMRDETSRAKTGSQGRADIYAQRRDVDEWKIRKVNPRRARAQG